MQPFTLDIARPMLSRVFKSSGLLNEPRRAAHALNGIGFCAKVAILFGVNPMFLVNASSVGLRLDGTSLEFRAALLGTSASRGYTRSSTSVTGRRGFCPQFPGRTGPTDNSMTGTSSSAKPKSRCTASASKPIIGVEPKPSERAA